MDKLANLQATANLIVAMALNAASGNITNQLAAGSLKATAGYNGPLLGVAGMQGIITAANEIIFAQVILGQSNLWKYSATGVLTQLTFFGQNVPIGQLSTGAIIFGTNRNGAHEIWAMGADGSNQAKLYGTTPNIPAYLGFLVIGQSNAEGMEALPVFPNLAPNSFMLNQPNGVRCPDPANAPIPPGDIINFVQRREQHGSPITVPAQTCCTAFAAKMHSYMLSQGAATPIYMGNTGQNGQSYNYIKQGTGAYNAGLQMVTAAMSLAGVTPFVMGALLCLHGESDNGGNSQYGANLLTWQQDYQTDIQAITGQKQIIPLITSQINSWATSGAGNVSTPTSPQLVDAAAQANPGIILNAGLRINTPCTPRMASAFTTWANRRTSRARSTRRCIRHGCGWGSGIRCGQ